MNGQAPRAQKNAAINMSQGKMSQSKMRKVAQRFLRAATSRVVTFTASAVMVVSLTGCSNGSNDALLNFLEGVGRLPGSAAGLINDDGVNAPLPPLDGKVLGSEAKGNKLLMIGDSIFAGAAPRYGNDMCRGLNPLGWRVAVEAEANRQVRFGREVLQARLSEGWDAAVVFLGTNFNGNFADYEFDLDRIVSSLSPRPTLLLTTSVFRPVQEQINEIIRKVGNTYPNVSILDWTTISTYEGVLSPDRVHPTPDGRAVLAQAISQAAGVAPISPGECLASKFTNDQLNQVIPQDTLAPPTDDESPINSSTSTIPTKSTSTTIAAPVTTTTVPLAGTIVPPASIPTPTTAN